MNYIKEDSKLKKLDNGPRTVLGYLDEGGFKDLPPSF